MAKILYIVNNLSLRSFTILSKDGKEQNALSHSSIIEELQRNCGFIEIILSKKWRFEEEDMLCITCTKHVNESSLEILLLNTSYYKSLQQCKLDSFR